MSYEISKDVAFNSREFWTAVRLTTFLRGDSTHRK